MVHLDCSSALKLSSGCEGQSHDPGWRHQRSQTNAPCKLLVPVLCSGHPPQYLNACKELLHEDLVCLHQSIGTGFHLETDRHNLTSCFSIPDLMLPLLASTLHFDQKKVILLLQVQLFLCLTCHFVTALTSWLRSLSSAFSAITSFSSSGIFISPCFSSTFLVHGLFDVAATISAFLAILFGIGIPVTAIGVASTSWTCAFWSFFF